MRKRTIFCEARALARMVAILWVLLCYPGIGDAQQPSGKPGFS